MKKFGILSVALASLAIVTSCSQDDLEGTKLSSSEISFHTTMGLKSRATEVKTADLKSIYISAFESDKANYMDKVNYTAKTENTTTTWSTSAGKFFWPASGTLNFYSYAPEITTSTKNTGTVTLTKDNQNITDYTPSTTPSEQVDLLYAKTSGSATDNGSSGVTLTFGHALAQISVQAKTSNENYTIKVKGVKIGNINGKGTFTFPTVSSSSDDSKWTLSDTDTDKKKVYETTFESNEVTLGANAANVDGSESFMLIPQEVKKTTSTKYIDGAYIALKVHITSSGGADVFGTDTEYKYVYIGIGTEWAKGKHYTYVLDFTNGAGQDESGNNVYGSEIKYNVTVTPMTTETAIETPMGTSSAS